MKPGNLNSIDSYSPTGSDYAVTCARCSSSIPDGAYFCPNCGGPVTEVAGAATPYLASGDQVRLVCPKCETQTLYNVDPRSRLSLVCPKCRATFESLVTRIRAKRSIGSKKTNQRTFSVRVQNYDGTERLIEFVNSDISDFELRSRDVAAFSYLHGQLRVVQNINVNQYMMVSKPSCFIATYVYGADSPEVQMLRAWRDSVLLLSPAGVRLVEWYYRLSEPMVSVCRDSSVLKHIARALLYPMVWTIDHSNWHHSTQLRRMTGTKVPSECPRRGAEQA